MRRSVNQGNVRLKYGTINMEEFETTGAEVAAETGTPQSEQNTEAASAQAAEETQTEGAAYWQAQYEKTQERLAKAEYTLTQKNLQAKRDNDDDDDDDDESPDFDARIESLLEQKLSQRLSGFESNQKEQALAGYDKNDRAEIEFHLANSVKQTGNIAKDVELAARLATAKRAEAVAGEMRTAFTNRPASGSTQGVRIQDAAPLPIDDAAVRQLRDLGLTDDEIRDAVAK